MCGCGCGLRRLIRGLGRRWPATRCRSQRAGRLSGSSGGRRRKCLGRDSKIGRDQIVHIPGPSCIGHAGHVLRVELLRELGGCLLNWPRIGRQIVQGVGYRSPRSRAGDRGNLVRWRGRGQGYRWLQPCLHQGIRDFVTFTHQPSGHVLQRVQPRACCALFLGKPGCRLDRLWVLRKLPRTLGIDIPDLMLVCWPVLLRGRRWSVEAAALMTGRRCVLGVRCHPFLRLTGFGVSAARFIAAIWEALRRRRNRILP